MLIARALNIKSMSTVYYTISIILLYFSALLANHMLAIAITCPWQDKFLIVINTYVKSSVGWHQLRRCCFIVGFPV